jgi:hypothetical protein
MKLLHVFFALTIVGATAQLSADTTTTTDAQPTSQVTTAAVMPVDPNTAATPVEVVVDNPEAAGSDFVDFSEATIDINPDIMNQFGHEPTLTDKLKWALAYLRMKLNIACDATGSTVANGYDKVTLHISRHKKAYIIGTICVGGTVLGVWYLTKAKK